MCTTLSLTAVQYTGPSVCYHLSLCVRLKAWKNKQTPGWKEKRFASSFFAYMERGANENTFAEQNGWRSFRAV